MSKDNEAVMREILGKGEAGEEESDPEEAESESDEEEAEVEEESN